MFICILYHDDEMLIHRNTPASQEGFLKVAAPYPETLVINIECIFTWYLLAALVKCLTANPVGTASLVTQTIPQYNRTRH